MCQAYNQDIGKEQEQSQDPGNKKPLSGPRELVVYQTPGSQSQSQVSIYLLGYQAKGPDSHSQDSHCSMLGEQTQQLLTTTMLA